MYIKKEDREFIEKMNKKFKIPKDFDEFIDEVASINLNLILKSGNTHTCTYCNHSFKSKVKTNEKETCPKCHNSFLVKSKQTKNMLQEMDVGILDKLDNELVVRVFHIHYYYMNGKYAHQYREYVRAVVNGKFFLNSSYKSGMYCSTIYMEEVLNKWRIQRGYDYVDKSAIFYPNNLKRLLGNTEYKYSMIWDLVKHSKKTYIDMEKLLKTAKNCLSLELLTKLKLYNLAIYADKYNIKGNFESRFGISKDYYNFMKKHNLNPYELTVLRLIKKKDINLIRDLTEKYNADKLVEFSRLTKIENLFKYEKIAKEFDFDMYLDYLENAKVLGYDLKDRKILFPEDLKESHDFTVNQVKVNNGPLLDKSVQDRFIELSNNIYKDNVYFIRPPKDKSDFMDEAKQQKNCVYTNYYSKHAKYKTDIYFMRSLENPNKSLVTVEVLNNKIVQKKRACNDDPSKEEIKFLEKWENNVLERVA